MPPPGKDQVFISYSHEDTKWREDLEKHLKPYLRAGSIKSWSDKQISPGSQWLTEIKTALTSAKVAVLLVTPDFIASDFIHEYELGPVLKEAKQGGVRILWVPVRASSYKKTALKDYQAVLDPAQPLAHMTHAQRDQAWVKICEELESALALSPAPAADLSSNKPDDAAAPLEDINGDAIAARNAKDSVEAAVAKKSPDVELDRATSTKVGTGLKPEDHIQRAQTSWRQARQDYESLGVNTENQRTRIDALYRWKDSAEDYFSKQADAFFVKQPRTENSWNESYAERVLNELADHHATIGQSARQLGIDPRTLVPPFIKFRDLQACLREKEPQIASALRNRFIEVGLPTYGFDEKTSQDLEWRWFILGCVLLLFAIALVLWGFSLAKLTWDQQRLLVWALPLASGFSAAAFAGSIYTQARNWIPGIAITATGGFAVWLITFFWLFPESKVKPDPRLAALTPNPATSAPPLIITEKAATLAQTPQRQTPVQTPTEAVKAMPEATASPPQQPPEGRQIDYFFSALPPQDFTKSAPSDLLQIIRSGGKNILDLPNGYMFLKGDGAQVSLQIALFPDASQHPFLAIAWGNLGGPDFTHLSFFTERNGRMVPANRTILPVGDSDELRFELPRYGLTLAVQDSSGQVLSKWTWNSDHARFEKSVAPKPTRSPEGTPERVEGRQIDYFFRGLPPQVFATSPPSDLLRIIKSGGDNIFDLANGYMFLKGNGAQVSLRIALFLYDANRRPLLAVAWGDLGGPDFTHLSFFNFNEKDGKMVQADRTIFPVPDSDRIRFELPREGQTVKVWNSSGKLLSAWTWNSDHARFEKG